MADLLFQGFNCWMWFHICHGVKPKLVTGMKVSGQEQNTCTEELLLVVSRYEEKRRKEKKTVNKDVISHFLLL